MPDLEKIKWSFDESRNLRIELKSIKATDKTTLRGVLQGKFENKVELI